MASAAFDALIEALDIAYDVNDDRPFWKTRLRAIGLGIITAGLVSTALAVMIVGPRFGAWLAARIDLSSAFVLLWPVIHWSIAILFTLIAVELVYFPWPQCETTLRCDITRGDFFRDLLARCCRTHWDFIFVTWPISAGHTEPSPDS